MHTTPGKSHRYCYTLRYSDIPEESVLPLTEVLFRNEMASAYLCETEDDQRKHSYAYLKISILSLGSRLEDYAVLETVLDSFCKIIAKYDLQKYFYEHLAIIVDWKSKVAENILRYLMKKANTAASCASEEQLYNDFVKGWTGEVIPFKEMPYLSGGKLVIVNIKTEAAKDFWKGYFAYVKKVREEEYAAFQKKMEEGVLCGIDRIEQALTDSWIAKCNLGELTTMDVAQMKVTTNYMINSVSASTFQGRITAAQNSYDTVKINPIAQVKLLIMKLLGKG